MSIFPRGAEALKIELKEVPELIQPMCKSFVFDFEKGDFLISDGKLVKVEGEEAIKIWIEKILKTEKFKFKIYEREDKKEYGVTIKELIVGSKFPTNFIYAAIQNEIISALLKHPEISQVVNFKLDRIKRSLNISFTVVLKNGETFLREVKI